MSELLRIAPSIAPAKPQHTYTPTPEPAKKVMKRNEEPEKPKAPRKMVVVKKEDSQDAFADNPDLYMVNGVHIDLFDYFCLSREAVDEVMTKRLQAIQNWISKRAKKGWVDGMRQLNKLDIKLGASESGMSHLNKMYNWIRLRYGNS